jgi:DNA-binding transcriptional ArsR family regulator
MNMNIKPRNGNALVARLRALGEPTRLALALLLADGGELGATQLLERLDVSQPSLSRHLKVLRSAGVIRERRDGRNAYYQLSGDPMTRQILNMSIHAYKENSPAPTSPVVTPSEDPPPASEMEDWML